MSHNLKLLGCHDFNKLLYYVDSQSLKDIELVLKSSQDFELWIKPQHGDIILYMDYVTIDRSW